MDELQSLLTTNNLRLTTPRRQVFAVLKRAEEPVSLAEIHAELSTVDRTSVYRALELYRRLRIVEVVHVGWKKRYELAEPFKPHHHHLRCTRCHELRNIATPELERLIKSLASRYDYTITHHHFELEGVCGRCRDRE